MKKYIFYFIAAFFIPFLFNYSASAQTVKTVGSGGDYSNLGVAFTAINNGNITGSIVLQIISSQTIAATSLNASGSGSANYTSVLIYPTGSGYSISGSVNDHLITFNGADNVSFDGRVNQSGSANLIISNTNTGTSASTFRFINSSENNIVQYCRIRGASTNVNGGVIFFATATAGNGNDGNLITRNEISGVSATDRPVNLLYSLGTSTRENSGNTISHNHFSDFFRNSSSSYGVNLGLHSTSWQIINNSFFETSDLSFSSNNLVYAPIYVDNPSGTDFDISGNFIGGREAQSGGQAWSLGVIGNIRSAVFYGIYINSGTASYSSIQGNTITNIAYASTAATPWFGIYIHGGAVNTGSITGNIIGNNTSYASISLTNANTNATAYGIFTNSSHSNEISNNSISSIMTVGSSIRAFNITGIHISSNVSGNTIVSNNLIGSNTVTNSLHASATNATGNTGQIVYGIYNAGSGNATISGNSISNLTNAYTGNNSIGRTAGIYNDITAGSTLIDNNSISHIYTDAKHTGIKEAVAVAGIVQASTISGKTQQVLRNKVSYIVNNVTNQLHIYGIYFSSSSATGNLVSRNLVHSITTNSTSAATNLSGIYLAAGRYTVANNIVLLGSNIITNIGINGIWDEGINTLLYHNTLLIRGNGTGTTYALFSTTANQRDFRNNLFSNFRSGGSNYAIGLSSTTNLTINFNNYYVSGSGGILGQTAGINRTSLAAWQAATLQDAGSLNLDPQFVNTNGFIYQDFYTNIFQPLFGTAGTGVTEDYTGALRDVSPRMGALERNEFVWQGGTSTDFGTASNWLNNSVPSPGAHIIFAADPDRNCLLDQNRIVGDITNAQGTDLLYTNGHSLTILGSLYFSNGAKIDAAAAGSRVIIAGNDPQILPAASFVNDSLSALTINTVHGYSQLENLTIESDLALLKGTYNIGANTLTLNGSIAQTLGILNGGSHSTISVGGTTASTTLPGITLHTFILNRPAGLAISGNLIIENTLNLSNGVVNTTSNSLIINGSNITATTGGVNASASGAGIIFNNNSPVNLPATFFAAAVYNLSINDAGIHAGNDFTVNGALELNAPNQSATTGLLEMGNTFILTMGPASSTTGPGDVNGRVKRNVIQPNIVYNFGSEYTTLSFNADGTVPTEILFIIRIGTAHPIKTDAVQRHYEILRTGGAIPNKFSLKLRYLDSELNGNDENKFVYWDHHIPYNGISPHEHGKTIQNTTENWMMLSEHNIRYLATEEYFGEQAYINDTLTPPNRAKIWILADRISPAEYVWTGALNSDWNDVANWISGKIPVSTSEVFIPNAMETPNDPILPDTITEIKALSIETSGILYGDINSTLILNGGLADNQGIPSLSNLGVFYPSTSTVIFENGSAAAAGTTDFYNVIVPTGDSLRLITGSIMRIAGSLTTDGILHTVIDGPTTVEYNGGDQTVIVPNPGTNRYSSLILSGSGIKTMPGTDLSILGSFKVDGSATAIAGSNLSFSSNFYIGDSAEFNTGNYNHVLEGNFENNGVFTSASGYSFTFDGTASQQISGSSLTSFSDLIINNASGVFMFADIQVNGLLDLESGNLNVGSYTLGINGTTDPGSQVEVSSLSSLSFGGSNAYTIDDNLFTTSPSINNLTINNSGGVVAGQQYFTINGLLSLKTGTFDISGKTLTIKGDVSRISGSLLTDSSSILNFEENPLPLQLPDDMFSSSPTILDLTISRSGGITTGNQPITVEGTLILSNGIVNTTGGGIIILTASADVSTDGINNIAGSVNSHVEGCLRKIGNTAFSFPLGRGGRYAPLSISAPSGGGDISGYFTACYYDYSPGADLYDISLLGTGLNHVSEFEYWMLDRSGTNNVHVTLPWGSHSGQINVPADMRVARWNGSEWVSEGNSAFSGNIFSGAVSSDLVSDFSPFTLGSSTGSNALPISLLTFTGRRDADKILLEWVTATELNNDYFTLEKSTDGENWNEIERIRGAGNSNIMLYYHTYDLNPSQGMQYYRLKQTDYDSHFSYSEIVAVEYVKIIANKPLVYPNPASSYVTVSIDEESAEGFDLKIVNSTGKVVLQQNNLQGRSVTLDVSGIAQGSYFLEIIVNGERHTTVFIRK
jgi:hypothetical protein